MVKKSTKKNEQTLEQKLWAAADKLRGNQEPGQYKHIVLGLIFLKYISDRFVERRAELEESLSDPDSDGYVPNVERRERFLEDRDEYQKKNVKPLLKWVGGKRQLLPEIRRVLPAEGYGHYFDPCR